jgi:2-polyprenyl-3-methyl-5-hydroxy-6-metoxy-1,4-benzoquinol methylase
MINEINHLEQIASNSLYCDGVNTDTINYSFEIASRFISGSNILEMGPAEGVMTSSLNTLKKKLTVLEGSKKFCKDLSFKYPEIEVIHSLFENFSPETKYDNIILGHVLEHVEDPIAVLKKTKEWLTPETGIVFAAVPNARSLHRQAAVLMDLLEAEDELNKMDLHHGHRRVFTPETFRNAFTKAGLNIKVFGGYWLKPLSNKQIEDTWSKEMLYAFMQLGERYPDISGEIYIVAS